ncbi:MAG: hypothetical protein ACK44A_03195 [Roseateles sp.]
MNTSTSFPFFSPALVVSLALGCGAAAAAPVAYSVSFQSGSAITAASGASHDFDIAGWARQALGGGGFRVLQASLSLSFTDDQDEFIDRGSLGYDGQTTTQSAFRGSRDGRNGLITQRVIASYESRGMEGEAEGARIFGVGLEGGSRSASRQWAADGPTPVEVGRDWSGWTCYWWGCSGTETVYRQGTRYRYTSFDGDFGFEAWLGRDALADLSDDGRWRLNVGAQMGDFIWRGGQLDLVVEALPDGNAVPEPAGLALMGLSLACAAIATRGRRRLAQA